MAVNFRELLATRSGDLDRPRPILPRGHYVGTIVGHDFGLSRARETPFARFFLRVERACPDVDPAQCEGLDFIGVTLDKDYFLTRSAMWRLGDMLDAVIGNDNRTLEERIPATTGTRVEFHVTQRESSYSGRIYNEITSILAIPPGAP
jgi:hypothetical protein